MRIRIPATRHCRVTENRIVLLRSFRCEPVGSTRQSENRLSRTGVLKFGNAKGSAAALGASTLSSAIRVWVFMIVSLLVRYWSKPELEASEFGVLQPGTARLPAAGLNSAPSSMKDRRERSDGGHSCFVI